MRPVTVDPASGTPPFEQLRRQVAAMVAEGTLSPGSRMPTVRRLAADPFEPLPEGLSKCLAFKGSTRGFLFPWSELLPTQGIIPALIVEGELDAVVGWQAVGHMVHVVTVGGASHKGVSNEGFLALLRPSSARSRRRRWPRRH